MTSKTVGPGDRQLFEPLLSVAQVAKIMNVCTKTVYRHIADGQLGAVRAGRLWRVPHKSLRDFLRRSAGQQYTDGCP